MSRLLAVDWGSSSLRAALVDDDGTVVDERSAGSGMLKVERSGFDAAFESEFGDWMDVAGTRCLMAGMVGSRQGWVEADYVPCPCGIEDFVAHLRRVGPDASSQGRDIAIVPGAACVIGGVPDVLRGEEVKVLGVLELLGVDSAVVVSPGTHSKWMTVENGRLVRFSTAMTGEFYALLRQHSILARSMPTDAEGELDGAAFDDGVERALRRLQPAADGVQRAHAVALRAIAGAHRCASYLSGLVIGEELRCRPLEGVVRVAVVGAPALTERFARALSPRGIEVRSFDEDAVWRGLWALDRLRRQREGGRR